MQQKHFISHPDKTRHARSRIKLLQTSNRERSKTQIVLYTHVLCDDLVLFRLRSKSSVQSALGLHFFLSIAIGVKTSSKKTSIRRTERKTSKHDLASFSAQATPKGGPKPLQKLTGAANLQSKKSRFLASKQN